MTNLNRESPPWNAVPKNTVAVAETYALLAVDYAV